MRTIFSLGWRSSTLHSNKSYQLTLPSWRSVKGSCRTQDTTKGVVLWPLCACVIGLGSNVSLSRWPSQLRLRDERHRLFLFLPRRFTGGRPMICQKLHKLTYRSQRLFQGYVKNIETTYYGDSHRLLPRHMTQHHLQSFRPVSPCGTWVTDVKVARKKFIGAHKVH